MDKKLSFAVENVDLVKEDPNSNFSLLSLDFFASGLNKHNTYISEETLQKYADTIYNCPLVWSYDPIFEDSSTHKKDEIPCGTVPKEFEIKSRILEDGRTMLTVMAYVWKKYSGKLMDFFKRDSGRKPVSVEMSVFDTRDMIDEVTELIDYRFEAVTILGSLVTPAIPLAEATVMQFAAEREEYQKAYNQEFSKYIAVDFKIPEKVKNNAKKALELNSKYGVSSPVNLAMARYLLKNETANPDKIRQLNSFFKKNNLSLDKYNDDNADKAYISYLCWGSIDGAKWAYDVSEKLDQIDKEHRAFYGTEDVGTVAVSDKHRKELELDELEKMAAGEAEKKEEEKEKKETPKEEVKETPKAEDKEEKAEDKKEEIKEKKEEKMSLDAYLDVTAMLALLEKETDTNKELASEFAKPEPLRNYGLVMGKMYEKMCKMAKAEEEMGCKMAELDQKMAAYATENDELKKFKADTEAKQFEYETNRTLKEIENSVNMPKEEMAALREEAKKFSLENIEGWKNLAKAKAFNFGVKKVDENPGVVRYGMPFAGVPTKKSDSLWG